jgi:CheY-like chemotaxis protein
MVVDDDPSILFTVQAILESYGMDVTAVDSGQECLATLKSGFRGLILMDVMMPGMSGWETIRAIRDLGLTDGNVICMLTAITSPGEEMEDVKELILDYLRKPFGPDELLSTVRECFAYLS